jgi:hypothetical protein
MSAFYPITLSGLPLTPIGRSKNMTLCNLPSIYEIFGVSEEAIQALQTEAQDHRDYACEELCAMALNGNTKALQIVARTIQENRANSAER